MAIIVRPVISANRSDKLIHRIAIAISYKHNGGDVRTTIANWGGFATWERSNSPTTDLDVFVVLWFFFLSEVRA